jgi:hypothetical protein
MRSVLEYEYECLRSRLSKSQRLDAEHGQGKPTTPATISTPTDATAAPRTESQTNAVIEDSLDTSHKRAARRVDLAGFGAYML